MYSFMMVGPYPVASMWFDHVTCWEILRLGLLSCWDVSAIPSHIHHLDMRLKGCLTIWKLQPPILYHHFPPPFTGIPLIPSSYRLAGCSAQRSLLTGSEQTILGTSRADCTGPLRLLRELSSMLSSRGNSWKTQRYTEPNFTSSDAY